MINIKKETVISDDEVEEVSADTSTNTVIEGAIPVIGNKVIVLKSSRVYFKKDSLVDQQGNPLPDEKIALIKGLVKEKQESIKKGECIGTVVDIQGEIATIYLTEEKSFAVKMYLQKDKRFIIAKLSELGVLETGEDIQVDNFTHFMTYANTKSLNEYESEYSRVLSNIDNAKQTIERLIRDIENYKKNEFENRGRLEIIENDVKNMLSGEINTDEYASYYKGILKNSNIESLEVVDDNGVKKLLVTTKPLKYVNSRKIIEGKPLELTFGAYKILIDKYGGVKVANFTHHYNKGARHHCCVDGNFSVCMGGNVSNAIRKSAEGKDYASIIHLMIDFLKEPNYGQPYIQDVDLVGMQEITAKAESWKDYFNTSFYQKNNWDSEKYKEEQNKFRDKSITNQSNNDDEDEDDYYDDDES